MAKNVTVRKGEYMKLPVYSDQQKCPKVSGEDLFLSCYLKFILTGYVNGRTCDVLCEKHLIYRGQPRCSNSKATS